MRQGLQSLLSLAFPPQCLACGQETSADKGLCASCWRDAPFISGLTCAACDLPLPGESGQGGKALCDSCLIAPRPWRRGHAVFLYEGTARRLVLSLKHGDRTDLVKPMAGWMAARAGRANDPPPLVVPVPLHFWRRLQRRFNQSALLAHEVARRLGAPFAPDVLRRQRRTRPQEGMSLEDRFNNQRDAFLVSPGHMPGIAGRDVLLIDDVMTSGATLSAATEALHAAGVASVDVLVLARVARDSQIR